MTDATTRVTPRLSKSARRTQLDRVVSTISTAQDTLSSINRRFTDFQSGVRTSMENFGVQLIRVQSLLGVSQQQIQTLRADLERANRQMKTALNVQLTAGGYGMLFNGINGIIRAGGTALSLVQWGSAQFYLLVMLLGGLVVLWISLKGLVLL